MGICVCICANVRHNGRCGSSIPANHLISNFFFSTKCLIDSIWALSRNNNRGVSDVIVAGLVTS